MIMNCKLRSRHRHGSVFLAIIELIVITYSTIITSCNPNNCFVESGIPVPQQFFPYQMVDHYNKNVNNDENRQQQFWTQRYYTYEKYFKGPGHPIIVILGGEGSIEPTTGIFYPFVADHIAKIFGAFVIEPEHRFYGKSQPLQNHTNIYSRSDSTTTTRTTLTNQPYREDPRVKLFTPQQALYDAMTLLDYIRYDILGCSKDRFSSNRYCPVITVGGSYPGFLSALARIMFPHIVDMAYAASAPLKFYSQQVNRFEYYNHITNVAEMTYPGCANSVQTSLLDVKELILQSNSHDLMESALGICHKTTPNYITSDNDPNTMMIEELMMVIGYTFANDNMSNYPPSYDTRLYKACKIFTSTNLSSIEKVKIFLTERLQTRYDDVCWNMTRQLPSGRMATISSGDWSGVGTGSNGESWDFQTCTLLVEAIGFSKDSMFIPRDWTLGWLEQHCLIRFNVRPRPYELVKEWKFDQLVETNVTRILFTNGLKDGWSVGSICSNLSDSLLVLNFPYGAHHSDLSHVGPNVNDTDDIKTGYRSIIGILGHWLDNVAMENLIN